MTCEAEARLGAFIHPTIAKRSEITAKFTVQAVWKRYTQKRV
jgi:hypothetical protein